MKIGIVAPFQVISHRVVANRILSVLRSEGHECEIYDFEREEIPAKNILYVGTVVSEILSYMGRFLPEKNVVFYGTTEGFPIIDPVCIEKEVAREIKIVTPSHYSKMCLETVGLPVAGVVRHGIDMEEGYDHKFAEWLRASFYKGCKKCGQRTQIKTPMVLCIAGNQERKGIDRFILASKLVSRELRDPGLWFVLHSGGGYVNIPKMISDLEIPRFWYTNSYGRLPMAKVNALYRTCTVNVLPSYNEGFGLTTIEAMRYLKPTIAVDAQPMNEVIENEKNGLLIPCTRAEQRMYMDRWMLPMHLYSVDALTDAMIELIQDRMLMKSGMVEEIRKAREEYTLKNYIKLLDYF